jgi:hypothetical protein|tara:strand:+ start:117 stop:218 length:102 start_codon:yes stop_codon:yes gene_type:complete
MKENKCKGKKINKKISKSMEKISNPGDQIKMER